jgi:peptide/nickel transport system permease protein
VVILFFVSFLIYALMRLMPYSYVEQLAREKSQRPGAKSFSQWMEQLNAIYGLNDNIITGFFNWLGNALTLNFGDSWLYNMPVLEKFSQVIWDSFILNIFAVVLQFGIAIPLGIQAARHQYRPTDYIITVAALIGVSLPEFFFATLMKLVFSVKLGWFDLYGKVGKYYEQLDPMGQFFDIALHFILPILTITLVSIGGMMRYTRTNMLEVLSSDYIRTARAKGLKERKVIYYHGFRNTLIPIVTIFGGMLPSMFSGFFMIEVLFQVPGIGYTSYNAIIKGDVPFTMFYMVFMSVLILIGTLLADIFYAVADPRVRIS